MSEASKALSNMAKQSSKEMAKNAKESKKAAEDEKTLLEQRTALHKKMIAEYSKNPKVDLSQSVKQFDKLNRKIVQMYKNMAEFDKAKKFLEKSMLMTGKTPWGDSVVKQYSDLVKYMDEFDKKKKAIAENANGTTDKKYKEELKKEKKEAEQKKQEAEAESTRKHNEAVNSQIAADKKADAARQKSLNDAIQGYNKYYALLEKVAAFERRMGQYKGAEGMQMTKLQYFNAQEKLTSLKREAEAINAQSLANALNGSMLEGVKYKGVSTPYANSFKERQEELKKIAEEAYYAFQKTGKAAEQVRFRTAQAELKQMNAEAEKLARKLDKVNHSAFTMQNLFDKIGHRAGWVTTGMAEHLVLNTPDEIVRFISEMEMAMAGVQQVLPAIEGKQGAVNKEFSAFANIAKQYGQSAREVIEAGKSLGRMYGGGDGNPELGVKNTNILTAAAAKMATVDNFDMMEATRGLESALAQFNLQTSNSNELMERSSHILDVWTKLAHNSGASAQDLTQGVNQAGAAAYQAGVSFETLNALIATGVRNTAKSGTEIGNALKSMFSSILADKNIKNMEQFGINVYKTAADGTKQLRSMEEIIMEISLALNRSGKDAKGLRDFMMVVSGGKQQFSKVEAILGNPKELLRTIKEANTAQGFADKQLEIQMDTVIRKLYKFKAALSDIVVTNNGKGIINDLKWALDVLNNFLVGIQQSKTDFYSSTKSIVGWSLALGAVYKMLPLLAKRWGNLVETIADNKGVKNPIKNWWNDRTAGAYSAGRATVNPSWKEDAADRLSKIENTTAMNQNTTATGANTVAKNANSTATGRSTVMTKLHTVAQKASTAATEVATVASKGLALALAATGGPIGLAVTAFTIYEASTLMATEATGKAVTEQEKLTEAIQKSVEEHEKALTTIEQQTSQATSLANVYNELKDKIESKTLSEKESQQATEQLGQIEETVKEIMGESAVEFDENGKIKIASLKKQKEAKIDETIESLKRDKAAIESQNQYLQNTIDTANKEIETIQNRAKAYGILGRVMQAFWSLSAGEHSKNVDEADAQLKIIEQEESLGIKVPDEVKQKWQDIRNNECTAAEDNYKAARGWSGDTSSAEAEIAACRTQYEENSARIATLESKINTATADLAESKAKGILDTSESKESSYPDYQNWKDKHSGNKKGGKGAQNPPVDNTQSNQNKVDKANLNQQKAQYKAGLKKYDNDLAKVNSNADEFGYDEYTLKTVKGIFKQREAYIKGWKKRFGEYVKELGNKADNLYDEKEIANLNSVAYEAVIAGIDKWNGATMDLGGEGCVEAVEKMGSWYSDFLKREFDRGIRYIPTLMNDAAAEGIACLQYDANQLEVGDLVVWNNAGNTQNHVGIYYGEENGVKMVADNSSKANHIMTRPLDRSWQDNEYIIKTGGGNGGIGSMPLPNVISNFISKEDWQKLDLKGKRDFLYERSETNENLKALLGQIENLINAQKQVNDVISDDVKNAVAMSKAIGETAKKVVSDTESRADYEGTEKLAQYGLDATDLVKTNIEIEKLSKTIYAITEMLPNLNERSKTYKELKQKEMQAELDRMAKLDEYLRQKKDVPIQQNLDSLERHHELENSDPLAHTYSNDRKYLQEKYDLLSERRDNHFEEWKNARTKATANREEWLANIEDAQNIIAEKKAKKDEINTTLSDLEEEKKNGGVVDDKAIDKAKADLADLTKEIDKQNETLKKNKEHWENSFNADSEEGKAKARLENDEIELAKVKREIYDVEWQLRNTVESGVTNMFSGMLLQGQSFKDGWKSLWQNIGQIAIQQLMKVFVFEKLLNIGSWFGGLARGGSVSTASSWSAGTSPQNFTIGGVSAGSFANGGKIPAFATGGFTDGLIRGAGTGTSDSILTYLAHRGEFIKTSNGEYIVQQKAVNALGVPFLDMLNKNPEAVKSMRRYASGGSLGYEYVPNMSPSTQKTLGNYTKTKASNDMKKNGNAKLESLMAEQTSVIKDMGNNGDGKVVILNTQADSATVLKALKDNPRALQAILGGQRKHGFR